ncbi:MAG TPA: helix-turn-helix transcriptional regulator [Gammaproteobacteria bacterium]|nr:helix-turn-helix transcriptional regulator [Gammaproteobacteria bacterium]
MNAHIEYQTILEAGVPRFAVVPIDDFRDLLRRAGETQVTIPHEVISASVDGLSPVRAWREYLQLSQATVAERMAISQPAYAQMESSEARLRKATRERIAQALGLIPEQLDF